MNKAFLTTEDTEEKQILMMAKNFVQQFFKLVCLCVPLRPLWLMLLEMLIRLSFVHNLT
jgi:hypothetical protein